MRTSQHLVAACAWSIGSALAGYAGQFGDFIYEEYDSTIEIRRYSSYATGDVIIPSEIVGKPVTSIGYLAFERRLLTSVTIPDSVTSIGDSAFYSCRSLTNVSIGSGVTSIGKSAFYGSDSLVTITVDAANSAYSSMDGVLFDKSQATLLEYPNGKLGSYTIPASVTNIGDGAFRSCSSLTNITIPDSVTSIGDSAFAYCSTLTSVSIPNRVTDMGKNTFLYCTSLTSVTIGNSVTSIGDGAFYLCGNLTRVTIPDGVTSIGDRAFYLCGNLTSVTIPDGVTSIGSGAFDSCASLTAITVNSANSSYSSVDGVLFNRSQTTLLQFPGGKPGAYTIPDSVTSFDQGAFNSCSNLSSVTIGTGITSIGDWAFFDCSSLTSVTIHDKVTSIGDWAFFICRSLTSVTIPDSVTSIGERAFSYCNNLEAITVSAANPAYSSVDGVLFDKTQTTLLQFPGGKTGSYTIPDSVTSILEQAFRNCGSLNDPYLSASFLVNFREEACRGINITMGSGLTSIGSWILGGCANLTGITIGTGVTSIGQGAFRDCESLRYVMIPDNVTSIGEGAFANCSSLNSVTIPDSVTSIGQGAFINCGDLTTVTIGNGVTSIGESAFANCSNLTSITIPDNVTSIGLGAFVRCSSLKAIYFEGDAPTLGWRAFAGADNATVYFMPGTTGWSATYGSRPTVLTGDGPDSVVGGIPIEDLEGWYLSEWWGVYNPVFAPWLFHAEHGYIYRLPSSTNESQYFYDDAMGAWWWSNETVYPFVYAFAPPADHDPEVEDAWLFYFEGSSGPRLFGVVTGDQAGSLRFFNP